MTWDLHSHTQLHALYQKLLSSLADSGTLIGVASKNDPAVAAKAFERKDLSLKPEQVFPVEVHWKREIGQRGADPGDVEHRSRQRDFRRRQSDGVGRGRRRTSRHRVRAVPEERLRRGAGNAAAPARSLRQRARVEGRRAAAGEHSQGAAFREQAAGGAAPESFLQDINAVVTFDFAAQSEPRVFELVNKTNQFNLNGRRYTEGDWRKLVSAPDAVLAAISYEDKFGPLGTIAVLAGQVAGERLNVEAW